MIAAPATKLVAVGEQILQQRDVLGVARRHRGSSGWCRTPARPARTWNSCRGPTTSWPAGEQLLDEVAGDEPGRAGDENLHVSCTPFPKKFQTSMTGLPSGITSDR